MTVITVYIDHNLSVKCHLSPSAGRGKGSSTSSCSPSPSSSKLKLLVYHLRATLSVGRGSNCRTSSCGILKPPSEIQKHLSSFSVLSVLMLSMVGNTAVMYREREMIYTMTISDMIWFYSNSNYYTFSNFQKLI